MASVVQVATCLATRHPQERVLPRRFPLPTRLVVRANPSSTTSERLRWAIVVVGALPDAYPRAVGTGEPCLRRPLETPALTRWLSSGQLQEDERSYGEFFLLDKDCVPRRSAHGPRSKPNVQWRITFSVDAAGQRMQPHRSGIRFAWVTDVETTDRGRVPGRLQAVTGWVG